MYNLNNSWIWNNSRICFWSILNGFINNQVSFNALKKKIKWIFFAIFWRFIYFSLFIMPRHWSMLQMYSIASLPFHLAYFLINSQVLAPITTPFFISEWLVLISFFTSNFFYAKGISNMGQLSSTSYLEFIHKAFLPRRPTFHLTKKSSSIVIKKFLYKIQIATISFDAFLNRTNPILFKDRII